MAQYQYQPFAFVVQRPIPPTPLSWAPKYADSVAAKSSASVSERTVPATATTTNPAPLSWNARYPDQLSAATLPVSEMQSFAATKVPDVTTFVVTGQMGGGNPAIAQIIQYQDYAAPASAESSILIAGVMQAAQILAGPSIQYQSMTGPSATTAVAIFLNWQPEYPDQARAIGSVQTGEYARPQQQNGVPTSWMPKYPDRIDTAKGAAIGEYAWADVQAVPRLLSWLARYADTVSRQATPIPDGTTTPFTQATTATADLRWLAKYPDQIAAISRAMEGLFVRADVQTAIPVIESWLSEFADFARGKAATLEGQWVMGNAQTAIPVIESWLSQFTDRVVTQARVLEGQYARADVQTAIPVIESWLSEYADFARGKSGTPESSVTFQTPDRSITVPREWSPTYPDFATSARTAVETFQSYAANISPIAVPVNQLGWRGVWPDWLPTQRPIEFPAFTTGLTASSIPLPRPLVWLGRYPDLAPGPRPLTDWQTLAFNPFPISIPTNQMGWRGYQPAWLPLLRPIEYPAFTTGLTASSIPLPRPLVWQGRYPDLAPGPKPLTDWQTLAFNPYPLPVSVDQLGWRGYQPSWLPLLRPTEYPAFVTGLTASSIPLPRPLVWLGRYPDMARGPQPLTDWQTLAFNPSPITLTTDQLGWRGYQPAWLPVLRPTEYPAFTTGLTASSIPLVRPLVWQGRYPDMAPGARAVAAVQSFAFDPFPRISLTPLAWAPEYADMVGRLSMTLGPALAEVLALSTFAPTGWLPTYPDTVVRQQGVPTSFGVTALNSNVFVPPLSWGAEFPDLLTRPEQRRDSAVTAPFTQPTLPLLQAWLARFPDRIAAIQGVLDVQQAKPVASGIVPLLSWLGRYADRVDTAKAASLGWLADVNRSEVPPPVLSWKPKYDDFAKGLVLPVADMPFDSKNPSKESFVVITPHSWAPSYPDFARGPQPINVGPALAFLRLVIFGPSIICFQNETVMLPFVDFENWLSSYMSAESVTLIDGFVTNESISLSSMTDEQVMLAAFTNESAEVC